ncbi:MAG: hypothetical protein QXI11_08060 [Thermoproteota archaeon]
MSEEVKVPIGTIGISLEDIRVGHTGEAYFPSLDVRTRVYAIEYIRKHRDIIIVGANNTAKEHSPVEISYETADGIWQRVTENHPFPVSMGRKPVTYVTVKATAAGNTEIVTPSNGKKIRVHWYSISNKHTTLADVGMRFSPTGPIKHRYALAPEGGSVSANLTDANWEGGVNETLYAYLAGAYSDGVYFTVGYTEE